MKHTITFWFATFSISLCARTVTSSDSWCITPVTDPVQHAEGPHWDENGTLYFVDTFQHTFLAWNSTTDTVTSHKFEDRDSIGVAIPIKNETGSFIIGADRYLYKFLWDGLGNQTGSILTTQMIEKDKELNQFNDGKADANGNLWIGTLTRQADLSVTDNGGSLYRMVANSYNDEPATFDIEEKVQNTSISNGMAFSSDNKKMFWVDSATYKVFSFDLDLETGTLSNRTVLFDVQANNLNGIPDGMTIDSDDNIWVALFGGHGFVQVSTTTGELLQYIEMPATYVTSLCFGGENLDTLFATTSRLHLDDQGLADEPLAGSVFEITGLGVKGVKANDIVVNYYDCV